MESLHDLEVLIETGQRLIVVETVKEGCFIEGFKRIARRSTRAYFQWTVTKGLLRLAQGYKHQKHNNDINALFAQVQSTEQDSVFILTDFHHHIDDPISIRHIKDTLHNNPNHVLVLLSQAIDLPDELKPFASHYDLPLPSPVELKRVVNDLAVNYLSERNTRLKVSEKGIIDRLVEKLCGLSHVDAERLARHAIYDDGIIDQSDLDDVAKQKFDLLDKGGVLNFELDYEELHSIAGFDNLKKWLSIRQPVFSGDVNLPGGDIPKGMLLLGVQGCGKSLAAKAVAGSWKLPLLHLDFGTLYNRFYGQTEENLRSALKIAEQMSPCVLWLDEIEKGLSAVSTNDDVSKRMLGTFLTWLAENKQRVFVVATANDVTVLPPELLRKGRFDEVFFVDLPDQKARVEILKIHCLRREIAVENLDLEEIAEHCAGFSGAEIEQLIVSAVYASYSSSQQENKQQSINTRALIEHSQTTRPLSVLMSEKIENLRSWAQGRAVLV